MNQQFLDSVTAGPPALLNIVRRSGKQSRFDLSDYLNSPSHEALKKPGFFAKKVSSPPNSAWGWRYFLIR
jgi:hypothetical protein